MRPRASKLSQRDAQALHTIVAKLIFLCKQACLEILTGVAFLTARVRDTSEDDNNKLRRILKYLIGTRDLVLTLESDGTGMAKWWVDAALKVHNNMKRHTGGMVSMGRGALYSASNKKKLNTKRLTETDMVGVDDLMPQILWMR